MTAHTIYPPDERPEVEVEVEGTWFYGLLRMWKRADAGAWIANVSWSSRDGNRIDDFPAFRVRLLVDPEQEQGKGLAPRPPGSA